MQYILLLRGVNVGGKNKVSMATLKEQLVSLGFSRVISYINSGNLIFSSEESEERIKKLLAELFASAYDFEILFSLISSEDYRKEAENLPAWWSEPLARRDVIFVTDTVGIELLTQSIASMKLHNEVVHFGKLAVFWGKYDESEFLKTAYHKELMKQSYYKRITIRNGNTFDKLLSLLGEES